MSTSGAHASDIEVSIADGIQTIRITRPQKKNALTAQMYVAMADALEAGDAREDVAVHVFLGSGGIFCAGNDIGDFLSHAKGGAGFGPTVERFIRALPGARKPMIAGVDGPAVGVGTTMLLHMDMVFASPTAVFHTPFLDLGLVPEAASSLLMPRRFGHAVAFEMLVAGTPFSAERGERIGLVNAVLPTADLEAQVRKAALRLAARPPEALRLSRDLMRGDPAPIRQRMDEEIVAFRRQLASPEAREAFEAFLAKRPPDFSKLRAKG